MHCEQRVKQKQTYSKRGEKRTRCNTFSKFPQTFLKIQILPSSLHHFLTGCKVSCNASSCCIYSLVHYKPDTKPLSSPVTALQSLERKETKTKQLYLIFLTVWHSLLQREWKASCFCALLAEHLVLEDKPARWYPQEGIKATVVACLSFPLKRTLKSLGQWSTTGSDYVHFPKPLYHLLVIWLSRITKSTRVTSEAGKGVKPTQYALHERATMEPKLTATVEPFLPAPE